MRHPDGTALFDWDFYNITGTANFMLSEQAGADKKDIEKKSCLYSVLILALRDWASSLKNPLSLIWVGIGCKSLFSK